ncbi:hypothetical protein Tco_1052934 [Tanacetum coccineum]
MLPAIMQSLPLILKVQLPLDLNTAGYWAIRLGGYSSQNVDINDGRSTTGDVFYLDDQRSDPLMKALARIRFKEMRSLLGGQELPFSTQKFRG